MLFVFKSKSLPIGLNIAGFQDLIPDFATLSNFKDAGVTDEEFDRYAIVNGRTRLSPWTNGGGSSSALPGMTVETHAEPPALSAIENYSTFIG